VELPTPAARYLGPADRGLLAGMRCSTGAWFENDVETFIQTTLADYHDWRRAHTDHAIVGAVVARENTRSLRLCSRIGLTDERDDPDERFVQRIGRIVA
jgi:hypothetical protein